VRVAVIGLWHLGAVTAAGLAGLGHDVRAVDPERSVVDGLLAGRPAVDEPGLIDALAAARRHGRLHLDRDVEAAVADADVVWITLDTPTDNDDRARSDVVVAEARRTIDALSGPAVVVVSSQVPAGTVDSLAQWAATTHPELDLRFAYVPENLRLGEALTRFTSPDHLVIGAQDETTAATIRDLLPPAPATVTMSIASAEMVKVARNAHLAVQVALANEIAALAGNAGADAGAVASALRLDPRIGPLAYVVPGPPFSGGTLGRDLVTLVDAAACAGIEVPVLSGALASNRGHQRWVIDTLDDLEVELDGAVAAVLGLTYKAGTATLRRSWPVDVCAQLASHGASVRAYQPGVDAPALDEALERIGLSSAATGNVELVDELSAAVVGADIVVVATALGELHTHTGATLTGIEVDTIVVDPGGWVADQLRDRVRIYRSVGSVTSADLGRGGAPC